MAPSYVAAGETNETHAADRRNAGDTGAVEHHVHRSTDVPRHDTRQPQPLLEIPMRLSHTLYLLATASLFAAAPGAAVAGPTTTATDSRIVNTVQQPVPIRDASWQVWRAKGGLTMQVSAGAQNVYMGDFYTVPVGKRLVVEQGSLNCGMNGPTPLSFSVGVAPLANYADEYSYNIAVAVDMGSGYYRGTGSVQVAANAGDVVFMRVMRTTSGYSGTCNGALSGRLIDVQ
jgi:hypothetical protein